MGTPSSGTPASPSVLPSSSAPPMTTEDQHYALQDSTATALEPRVLQHAPALPVFEEANAASETENSEPGYQVRHFPDSSESGDEVRVIGHTAALSLAASSLAASSTPESTEATHARHDLIGQQIKTALLGKDRDGLRRLFKASPASVNAHLPALNSPPLVIAVKTGQRDIVEDLLAVPGIHVDARDSEHRNAVHVACEEGQLELVRLLVAHGANLNSHCRTSTPLIAACLGSNPELLDYVLKKTPRQLIDFKAPGGNTALANAVACGNLTAAGKLIARGADPDNIGASAMTPLHHAAKHGQVAMAKLLIRHGAVARKSTFGYPLDIACRSGCMEMIALLLTVPPAAGEWQGCALQTAIELHRPALLDWLLANGVSANALLPNQTSALMIAIDHADDEAAAVLVTRGADVAWLTPSRHSALSKAIEKKRSRDLILMLLSALPARLVLDQPVAWRLVRRAKRRQDYRIVNELATRKFEDRFGNAYELQGLLN